MATFTVYDGSGRKLYARGKHQVNALDFAQKHRGWHTFLKNDRPALRAIRALEKRGVLETKGDQFRFKPATVNTEGVDTGR